MTTTTRPPRTSSVPAIIPMANGLVRRLIGAGMPFGPNVLMTVFGRSSGRPHTFPVALIELDGGRRYVQSPFGEVNWVKNLRVAGAATVTKGRSREEVVAIELDDATATTVLHDALMPYLRSRLTRSIAQRYFHIRANSTPAEWAALAVGHPTFELRCPGA